MRFLNVVEWRATALCFCSVFGLVACGGGGGGGSSSADTSTLSTTVIDGAIENATVCLDKNNNGVCDAGEPASKTNAAGKANLSAPRVQKEQSGKCADSTGCGNTFPPLNVLTPPTVQISVDGSKAPAGFALAASGHSALNAMAKIASQTAMRRDFKDIPIYRSYPKSTLQSMQATSPGALPPSFWFRCR